MEVISKNQFKWTSSSSNKKIVSTVSRFDKWLSEDPKKGLKRINSLLNIKNQRSLKCEAKEFINIEQAITDQEKLAIYESIKNITYVAKKQSSGLTKPIEPLTGLQIWERKIPIETVGLYVPGGTAPLVSSLIMQAVPAKIAGCNNIVICTPPLASGKVHPAILWTAKQLGISEIYKIGGAQAILAMANGYFNIPKVQKIFGPGNAYVAAAKSLVSNKIAIDMQAGPSEVMVVTNSLRNTSLAAVDILSQLEHGEDSKGCVVSNSKQVLLEIQSSILNKSKSLPRSSILTKTLKNVQLVKTKSKKEIIEIINQSAPEHLVLLDDDYPTYVNEVSSAGSVFCGPLSPVAFGDYASGSNHVLPTDGWAKSTSGLSVDAFMKKISFQTANANGFSSLAESVIALSSLEGLEAHKRSVEERLTSLNVTASNDFIIRETKETSIYCSVNVQGTGLYEIDTGIKFLDHMLEQLARNSSFDIYLKCKGDVNIDTHHTIEDVSIVLGEAINKNLGNRDGITRYADISLVMDECKANATIDLCSRTNLKLTLPKMLPYVGDFPSEMLFHFIDSFVKNAQFTCHLKIAGENTHHIIETTFKALGQALKQAVGYSALPSSTKGIL